MYYVNFLCIEMAVMQLIAASAGYLPSIGPAPLRFQGGDKTAAKPALPPLDMGNTTNGIVRSGVAAGTSSVNNSQQRQSSSNDIMGLLSPPALNGSNPNLITTDSQSSAGALGASIDINGNPQITAQMLVPFFNTKGATGQVTGILLATNISFTPPTPGPPSSSATYSTP